MPASIADTAARTRAHAVFDPVAAALLGRPGVDIGPMFGTEGLRIRGKVFAFIGHRGSLIVKLPAARIDELIEAGAAERMAMRERAMREWAVIDPDASPSWPGLVDEAYVFVDAITE